MDLARLAEPFPASAIDWRLHACGYKDGKFWGKAVAYLDNRAIMDRLDQVCGIDGWQNAEPKIIVAGAVTVFLAGISIRVEREWVTKWDGAEPSDIEPVKGGLSGSMKRAAVQWGIGRYLYNLPAGWVTITDDRDAYYGKTKDGKEFNWHPPQLPRQFLPAGTGRGQASAPGRAPGSSPASPRSASPATNGGAEMTQGQLTLLADGKMPLGAAEGQAIATLEAATLLEALTWCRDGKRAEKYAPLILTLQTEYQRRQNEQPFAAPGGPVPPTPAAAAATTTEADGGDGLPF